MSRLHYNETDSEDEISDVIYSDCEGESIHSYIENTEKRLKRDWPWPYVANRTNRNIVIDLGDKKLTIC